MGKNWSNNHRYWANRYQAMADKWLAFAKNKNYSKHLRVKAMQHYHANMRDVARHREMDTRMLLAIEGEDAQPGNLYVEDGDTEPHYDR